MTTTPSAADEHETTTPIVPLDEMTAALETHEASTLSRTITDIVQYRSKWWIYDRDGWIRIDDQRLATNLTAAADDMATADKALSPMEGA